MSAYSPDAVFDDGLLTDHASFVRKPFGPEDLASQVRAILDSRPTPAPDCRT